MFSFFSLKSDFLILKKKFLNIHDLSFNDPWNSPRTKYCLAIEIEKIKCSSNFYKILELVQGWCFQHPYPLKTIMFLSSLRSLKINFVSNFLKKCSIFSDFPVLKSIQFVLKKNSWIFMTCGLMIHQIDEGLKIV